MKAFSPESPRQRTVRKFSKPQMEKRRRERINHSLETLRLMMLENTSDESLKNPKVGKAEILESVVQFLKTTKEVDRAHRGAKTDLSRAQSPTCASQHNYRDGMRSCLLRVSHFIASKTQELMETGGDVTQASPPSHPPSSPGHVHRSRIPCPAGDPSAVSPQLQYHGIARSHLTRMSGLHCDTRELVSPTAASTHITDLVWRPWPQ
uniref:hairy-related 5 n=1 Tax=Scatophagus argus TaxID=75038 RepID=UPI001ED7E91A|nr:hairy-related 5 [Scatophagus argus]